VGEYRGEKWRRKKKEQQLTISIISRTGLKKPGKKQEAEQQLERQ